MDLARVAFDPSLSPLCVPDSVLSPLPCKHLPFGAPRPQEQGP